MERYNIFRIGRRSDNHIVLLDDSVSRCHAELVLTPDGQAMLTDRCSSEGTFVKEKEGWLRISHREIDRPAQLRFGDFSIQANKIINAAEEIQREQDANRSALSQSESVTPSTGFVRRNPEDGRIISS